MFCWFETISDANSLSMNVINIVKIVYMSNLVIYFELLKNTKVAHVQNEHVYNCWGCF